MKSVADALGNIVEDVGKAVEDVVYFVEDVGNKFYEQVNINSYHVIIITSGCNRIYPVACSRCSRKYRFVVFLSVGGDRRR